MKNDVICTYCKQPLDIGSNTVGVQQGVLGPQRFIPLEEPMLFCSDECVSRAFDHVPKMPPRVP
jgi:hypothetical protein